MINERYAIISPIWQPFCGCGQNFFHASCAADVCSTYLYPILDTPLVSIPQKHSQDELTSDEEYEKGLDDTYPPSKKLYKKSFCKSWLQTFI